VAENARGGSADERLGEFVSRCAAASYDQSLIAAIVCRGACVGDHNMRKRERACCGAQGPGARASVASML